MKTDANDIHRANGADGLRKAFDAAAVRTKPNLIDATPFVWIDPSLIPRRQCLYGKHYFRKFISETTAPPGFGKSTLVMTEALAIITGRPLLGVIADEFANVWYWNGEDPAEELQRRIAAAALHYQIDRAEIEGRLFLDTGREMKIIIAEQTRTGAVVARPIVDAVIATIEGNDIGLMIVDPFIASHRVVENDNPALEVVVTAWAEIADVTGCAIELVHHTRKTGGAAVTVEDSRGGSALLAKVRSARVINGMNEEEGAKAGVENRRSFFQLQSGKSSLTPPVEKAEWYQLRSVELGNGDNVGVVTRWTWPDPFEGVTASDLQSVRIAIAERSWRESSQARDWAGHAVASVLRLDAADRADKAKIKALLKTWISNGALVIVEGEDEQRNKRKFIEVGKSADD